MTILLMENNMQITAENNKTLTRIAGLVDCTPLRWHVISDVSVYVTGEKELLYELLLELTRTFLCKIEII